MKNLKREIQQWQTAQWAQGKTTRLVQDRFDIPFEAAPTTGSMGCYWRNLVKEPYLTPCPTQSLSPQLTDHVCR